MGGVCNTEASTQAFQSQFLLTESRKSAWGAAVHAAGFFRSVSRAGRRAHEVWVFGRPSVPPWTDFLFCLHASVVPISIKFELFAKAFVQKQAAMKPRTVCEGINHMADASNTSTSPDGVAVIPIYDAMLERALLLLEAGSTLDAVDMLATAAETMLRFDHPEATRVAGWAWNLLEDARLTGDHDWL